MSLENQPNGQDNAVMGALANAQMYNLNRIKELHERKNEVMKSFEIHFEEFTRRSADGMDTEERKERLNHLQDLTNETMQYCKEEVQLAEHSQELVDEMASA